MPPEMPVEVRFAHLEEASTIADFNVRLALESEGLTLDPPTVLAGVEALLGDPAKGVYLEIGRAHV